MANFGKGPRGQACAAERSDNMDDAKNRERATAHGDGDSMARGV
jgi:hypothetical protein